MPIALPARAVLPPIITAAANSGVVAGVAGVGGAQRSVRPRYPSNVAVTVGLLTLVWFSCSHSSSSTGRAVAAVLPRSAFGPGPFEVDLC